MEDNMYVRICLYRCIGIGPPLERLSYTAASTTEQINIVQLYLIPKRAILLPHLCIKVVPVPLRGGPILWQTKADSKNSQ